MHISFHQLLWAPSTTSILSEIFPTPDNDDDDEKDEEVEFINYPLECINSKITTIVKNNKTVPGEFGRCSINKLCKNCA